MLKHSSKAKPFSRFDAPLDHNAFTSPLCREDPRSMDAGERHVCILSEVATIMRIDAPGECGSNSHAEGRFAWLIKWPRSSLFRGRFELLHDGNTWQDVNRVGKLVLVVELGRLQW